MYLLFGWTEPRGGAKDFLSAHEALEDAQEAGRNSGMWDAEIAVFDGADMRIVSRMERVSGGLTLYSLAREKLPTVCVWVETGEE